MGNDKTLGGGGRQQDKNNLRITLSDGSRWIVRSASTRKKPEEVVHAWARGADIRLANRVQRNKQGDFILKNADTGEALLVDFDYACKEDVEGLIIDKIDTHGYFVSTPNIDWTIGWAASWASYQWLKGQKLLVNRSSYSGDMYLLIHVDSAKAAPAETTLWKN